ncbi:LacI family transcriptional regulator [Okibacterium sp. HSC-33S16]|uniref:LacI family DNA-binding transcriptional regulator n=1 Tax=Okibacterium sp. HSC-33S16 TaxID=2910965 RepID=UPI0020A1A915|nr:LacI family DNA-binding transcriptional regulator [Okibacterium sp. HSC-33S16]MCP2032668.1 LacI family transcriptional regulator [Okibacterium sp. HSC-33S16]
MTIADKPQNRPTLRDVASLAGVSVATASKALNGRDQVHPDTRARVLVAAEKISFTPNALARGLLAGQTGTVGLITGDLDGRFSLPILMGAEDAFGKGKMSVFLCDARGDSIREQYHLDALLSRRVDGLIVVGSRTDPRPSLGRNLPVPVVYAYAPSTDDNDLSLVPDDVQGAKDCVDFLISRGRRKIAHITGQPDYAAAQDRARGVDEGLSSHGLSLLGGAQFGSWTEQWGRTATARLIEQHPDVDGILCGNDQIARGALDTLRESGWDVPGRISVMGYDNWEVFTTGARPHLTSVDINLEALGALAARRLFEAIDGSSRSGIESLPCRIVPRETT